MLPLSMAAPAPAASTDQENFERFAARVLPESTSSNYYEDVKRARVPCVCRDAGNAVGYLVYQVGNALGVSRLHAVCWVPSFLESDGTAYSISSCLNFEVLGK